MSRFGTYLRRKLGVYEQPPPEERNTSKAENLREASDSKRQSADALSHADSQYSELAQRRQAESRMLKQLADELELTDSE